MDVLPNIEAYYADLSRDRRAYRTRWSEEKAPVFLPQKAPEKPQIQPADKDIHSVWQVGDWAEILPLSSILSTLDDKFCLDNMPFMPEMAAYCGQRYQVVKVAHKTCDSTGWPYLRRMKDAVHLQTRCDGACHGGCQAGCLFFWKTAWLHKVDGPQADAKYIARTAPIDPSTLNALDNSIHAPAPLGEGLRYRCQSTEIARAAAPISPFELLQYLRDITSCNVKTIDVARYIPLALLKTVKVWLVEASRKLRFLSGQGAETPIAESPAPAPLNLQPGDLVRIKARQEIMKTLARTRKNFGLSFDADMARYCGSIREVVRRVERVIDEKTGKMLHFTRDSYILKDVTCTGLDCRSRLFCPRGLYTYWRAAWLDRVAK